MPDNPVRELLRHSTYIVLEEKCKSRFKQLALDIEDWEALLKDAEANGLSNLVFNHMNTCGIEIPTPHDITFKALTARHRRNNRERTGALVELLGEFHKNNIESILLKGMALIHTLYSDDAQRPMGDIDILVRKEQAQDAQQSLRDIGFYAGDRKQGYLFDHHHLPIAHRNRNGMSIQVEVHHNALSGDAVGSMSFDEVSQNRIPITVGGYATATMGHVDMLRHLCHHAFEPCREIKLGHVADIYGYASRYAQEIDWEKVKRNEFFLFNTLRCLHFLCPLPDSLEIRLTAPRCKSPDRVGRGFPPLSTISRRKVSSAEKIRTMLDCSPWWCHVYYRVPPENSLWAVRWIWHPGRVAFWLWRRMIANAKSRYLH